MYDDDSLAKAIMALVGSFMLMALKYVCLAWAIAWGIHLASTL